MKLTKGTMLYNDGSYYKWKATEDRDNPYFRGGTDHRELNRNEGYEILYFINHLSDKILFTNSTTGVRVEASLHSLNKIEKMIRYYVPTNMRKREQIEKWILDNWKVVA